jgi:hypothetical protein
MILRSLTITLLFLTTHLFAISPFSLEGIKEFNIKVLDKSKFTTERNLTNIKKRIKTNLYNAGIKTKCDTFSNFVVKIQGGKFGEKYALHISMFIVEETYPLRNKKQETMSITYYKDDFFDSDEKELQMDIYDSVINYLLEDMLEQYKVENE